MAEVAMLHSRLHADTTSGNSKTLSVQGRYQGVRMAAFPGTNCSRASQQKQTCVYTVRSMQAIRKGHSHCSSLVQFSVGNKPELHGQGCLLEPSWFSHQMQSCLLSKTLDYRGFELHTVHCNTKKRKAYTSLINSDK